MNMARGIRELIDDIDNEIEALAKKRDELHTRRADLFKRLHELTKKEANA